MKRNHPLFLLIIILISLQLQAQTTFDKDYVPIKNTPINKDQLKKEIKIEFTDQQIIVSKYKKYLINVQDLNLDNIYYKVDSSIFIFDEIVEPYFQKIASHILDSNPELRVIKPRLFVSRELLPNAYAMGNGIMVFNLSLVKYLQSESEIAFIICHEFAHNYLRHLFNDIERKVQAYHSAETQTELKDLKKTEYNTYDRASKLALDLKMNDGRFSQTFEFQADSLGFELLKKTKYSTENAATALRQLDIMRDDMYPDSLHIDKYFNLPNYPFKPSWVKEPESFILQEKDSAQIALENALSSHPELMARIEKMKALSDLHSGSNATFLQDSLLFEKIKNIAHFEEIISAQQFRKYDKGIYLTLKMLERYPENQFLAKNLLKQFNFLLNAYENHTLMKFISPSSVFHHKDFKILNRMLNNLRISEYKKIANELAIQYHNH
jgi:hypothetical protein